MPESTPQFSQYSQIGDGYFSEVFQVKFENDKDYPPDKSYALKKSKRCFRSRSDRRFLLREYYQAEKLQNLRKQQSQEPCLNVVYYHRCWQTDGHLYTHIEFCSLGTLKSFLETRYKQMFTMQDSEYESKRSNSDEPKSVARGHSDSCGMESEMRPPSRCFGRSGLIQPPDSIGSADFPPLPVKEKENMRKSMHLNLAGGGSRPGSPLLRPLKDHLDEEVMWRFLLDIANGLKCIHEANLVHLDIKPANILISGTGVLKIADFGNTTATSKVDPTAPSGGDFGGDTDGVEGDNTYMAKELLHNAPLNQSADMFSFGLVMLEIAAGFEIPVEGEDWHVLRRGEIPESLKDQKLAYKLWTECRPDDIRTIVSEMIKEDPAQRPTSQALVDNEHLRSLIKTYNDPHCNPYVVAEAARLPDEDLRTSAPSPFEETSSSTPKYSTRKTVSTLF